MEARLARRQTKNQLVPVVGRARKPQMQQTSGRSWTREKEREFLEVLGETCNVTRACEAVGMSVRGAYKRRETTRQAAWGDLRAFLEISRQRGELVVVRGADPHLEMGALYELSLRKKYPPVLLFESIKGYPSDCRIATNVRTSPLLVGNLDLEAVRERVIKKLLRSKARQERG